MRERKRRQLEKLEKERQEAELRLTEGRRKSEGDDFVEAEDATTVPDETEKETTEAAGKNSGAAENDGGDEESRQEEPEPSAPGIPEIPVVASEARPDAAEEPEPAVAAEPEPEVAKEPHPAASESRSEEKVSDDLEALGRQLEQSIAGGGHDVGGASGTPPPPPPEMNATPEDILGVQTQRAAFEVDQPQEPEGAPRPPADMLKTGGGPAPMEEYEERAQMAKEVLRATSDQPRGSRRRSKTDEQSSDAVASQDEEPAQETEEHVRFSEDLTLSSRKRRRKLFGR